MIVHGIEKCVGHDDNEFIELDEVIFSLDLHEIENMIDFFKYVRNTHTGITTYGHTHYQFWDKKWTIKMPDIEVWTVVDTE